MRIYCLKDKRHTENVPGSERIVLGERGQPRITSICAACKSKKSRYISKEEAKEMKGEGILHPGESTRPAPWPKKKRLWMGDLSISTR